MTLIYPQRWPNIFLQKMIIVMKQLLALLIYFNLLHVINFSTELMFQIKFYGIRKRKFSFEDVFKIWEL